MRRDRLRSRCAVCRRAGFRRAGRRGRAGRRDRPAVRLRPPFRGQGLRHDEHARLRERTVRGRADRPRHVPGRSRRADRAGCRFSAYGSASDRVARLDADVQYGPGPRPLLVRGGLHEADRGTGGLARRNAADCRVRARPRDRSVRAWGDLRLLQRPLLHEPFDGAPQRQPGRLLAGVPAAVRTARRPNAFAGAGPALAFGTRSEPIGPARGDDRRRSRLLQDRGTAEGYGLCAQRRGMVS